jgi:hypothetical protein
VSPGATAGPAGPAQDDEPEGIRPGRTGVAPIGPSDAVPRRPAFAHASEAELARILDFYAVRWEYEPDVFPILWNLDGTVLESFSPDFYLPDLDLYVELTTLKQKLVRKKNRKLRRLRELYPYLRIKLLYARDFRALMMKYGKLALVDAMSGTPGQVLPPMQEPSAAPAARGATGIARQGGGKEPRSQSLRPTASAAEPALENPVETAAENAPVVESALAAESAMLAERRPGRRRRPALAHPGGGVTIARTRVTGNQPSQRRGT